MQEIKSKLSITTMLNLYKQWNEYNVQEIDLLEKGFKPKYIKEK